MKRITKKKSEGDRNTVSNNQAEISSNKPILKNSKDNENLNSTQSEDRAYNTNAIISQDRPSCLQRLWSNLSVFKYVVIILLIPPLLNFGALQREANGLIPDGEKVDMGWGQKMYIYCKGNGVPTVILDAPTGLTSDIWLFVQEELSRITKVCIYDRSGLGRSDPIFNEIAMENISSQTRGFVGQPHTLDQMTSDLHYLIAHIKHLPYPFVLVGSDIGSLIARMFSMIYTSKVSEIVLIDPLVENLFSESKEWREYWFSKLLPYFESLHLSSLVGVSRLALLLGQLQPVYFQSHVPEETVLWQKSLLCNPRHMNAVFYEHLYMNTSLAQMRDIWVMKQFPRNVSVSVITRNKPNEFPPHLHKAWIRSHEYLLQTLHPDCYHHIIQESDFLQLYSGPSPIVPILQNVIRKWRNRHSQF